MICFATKDDIPEIMAFIEENWKRGHILGNDRDFFDYEFLDGTNVNFAVSRDERERINGIEGFISYGKRRRDVCPVMWKVIKSNNPTLGIELLDYIIQNADVRSVMSPGINTKTIPIYRYMGIATGIMTQWYRLNPCKTYTIAKVQNAEVPKVEKSPQYALRLLDTFSKLQACFDFTAYYSRDPKPLKEDWYIEKRYYNHPIYRYMVYGIEKENVVDTFLVFRIQEHEGSRALRLVDVVGNFQELYNVTAEIDRLLIETGAEYADIYEAGLSDVEMLQAGWKKVHGSGNIIPNYFSPFVQENIDINYMAQEERIVLFKADGDQDRPN